MAATFQDGVISREGVCTLMSRVPVKVQPVSHSEEKMIKMDRTTYFMGALWDAWRRSVKVNWGDFRGSNTRTTKAFRRNYA